MLSLSRSDGTTIPATMVEREVARRARSLADMRIRPGQVVFTLDFAHSVDAVLTELALDWLGASSFPVANVHQVEQYRPLFPEGETVVLASPVIPTASVAIHRDDLPERIVAYMLTSGSTGESKVVPITRAQFAYTSAAVAAIAQVERGWRYVSHLSMRHVAERHWTIHFAPAVGLDVAIGRDAIHWHRPQFHFDVPIRWNRAAAADLDWARSLRRAISASAPLDPDVHEELREQGVPLDQLWGMSETANVGAYTVDAPPGTVGRPIQDATINDGELHVRGPNVLDRYVAGLDPHPDGWLPTGDRAAWDDDGWLRILGRTGDTIVTAGGVKIEPGPIEARVRATSQIAQVLVHGTGATRVKVTVVPASASISDRQAHDAVLACWWDQPREAEPDVRVVRDDWAALGLLTEVGKLRRTAAHREYGS